MTPDLKRLRESLEDLEELVEYLELELVDDPAWKEPSDTSYLRAEELHNPDIMANVDAMAATNKLISWFGRDQEGFVGLWRGPTDRALEHAPVVRLDTEGQYDLVAATVGDYLLISSDEDEFESARDTLRAAGFVVGDSQDAIWGSIESFDDPNAYRDGLYNAERSKRGLPPV